MTPKTSVQTRIFTEMVAQKQGWVLNPDREFYETLVEGLVSNFNRYGYFLCPCRDTNGSRDADKKDICPCLWSRLDVPEHGHCYCALYLSQEFAASGKEPSGIPDRRES
jgi:ferredoxin-thioredoxin reductase catalytic subunit